MTASNATQQTLTGEPTDESRERPDTFRWCHHCDTYVLRSRWGPHDDHDWRARRRAERATDDSDTADDTDDEPEEVGQWYTITLSYSVDYQFKVPGVTEHLAKETAKDLRLDAKPADEMHVHTEVRDGATIYEDDPDLPDDFDPFGSERLIDAIERAKDDQ